jgi:hypothetical protein
VPPAAVAPRAALQVKSNYSTPAELPRTALETAPLVPRKPRVLSEAEEANAWRLLALWLACAAAGIAWFWKFSREP